MSSTNPRVDAYIAKSADFARPILEHLRKVVRQAAPDIEETIKWGVPYFQRNGMVCGMAAFKQHCAFVFWNGKLVFDGNDAPGKDATQAMGQFGRITRLSDLPPGKVIIGYVKKAVALDEAGVKRAVKPRSGRPGKVSVPADLATAPKGNAKARPRASRATGSTSAVSARRPAAGQIRVSADVSAVRRWTAEALFSACLRPGNLNSNQ